MTTPNENNELVPEETRKAIGGVPAIVKVARAIVISGQDELDKAGEYLKSVVTRRKELETKRVAITKPMDAAKKAVMDLFRDPVAELVKAEAVIKGAIGSYAAEQERIRQDELRAAQEAEDEERRKREAEAQKAEDARLAAEAEQQRIADEQAAAAKEIEDRRQAEADALADGNNRKAAAQKRQREKAEEDEARLKAEADEAEQATQDATGESDEASYQAMTVKSAKATTKRAKTGGVSTRTVWKAKIDDPIALLRAIIDGKMSIDLVKFDQSRLDKMAQQNAGQLMIPGVRAVSSSSVSVRTK